MFLKAVITNGLSGWYLTKRRLNFKVDIPGKTWGTDITSIYEVVYLKSQNEDKL